MATVRKTVTFTAQQDKWIKAQIEAGEFTNDSEYLRNLVEGLESGVGTKSLPEIMKAVETRMRENGRL